MANNLVNRDAFIIIGIDESNDFSIKDISDDCNRKDTAKLEHECIFKSLYHFVKKNEVQSVPECFTTIFDPLLELIATTNISIWTACSEPMNKLIRASIAAGMANHEKYAE